MLNTVWGDIDELDKTIWKSVPEDAVIFQEASKEGGVFEYRYKNFPDVEALLSWESFCFLVTKEGVFFTTQEKREYPYGKLITMICVGKNRFVPMRHPNKEKPIRDDNF